MKKHDFYNDKRKYRAYVLVFVMIFNMIALSSTETALAVEMSAEQTAFRNSANQAIQTIQFADGDSLRLVNVTRQEQGKSKADATYKFDGENWKSSDKDKYVVWNDKGSNTFHAIHPGTAEYDKFTIPTVQKENIGIADWMTGSYTNSLDTSEDNGETVVQNTEDDTNAMDIVLERRLAKVTIVLDSWKSQYDSNETTIEDAKIYSNGINMSIAYNSDGTADSITAKGGLTGIVAYPSQSGEKNAYTAIVAPEKYTADDLLMSFVIKGEEDNEMSIYATAPELQNGLQAGYHYTFKLTVGKDKVELISIGVDNWTTDSLGSGMAIASVDYYIVKNDIANFTIRQNATAEDVKNAVSDAISHNANRIFTARD